MSSVKNLKGIFDAIAGGQAPDKFTQRYLESLGYKTNADRVVIGVLKSLKLLTEDGVPTDQYHAYLDQSQSRAVLAEAIRYAYSDLFRTNRSANTLTPGVVKNKLKTLSQGAHSDSVLIKMASTFNALCQLADFDAAPPSNKSDDSDLGADEDQNYTSSDGKMGLNLGGLVYNIQLILPESRDPKVYDALFQSLRKHLQ